MKKQNNERQKNADAIQQWEAVSPLLSTPDLLVGLCTKALLYNCQKQNH
jgi:hypothetical protein